MINIGKTFEPIPVGFEIIAVSSDVTKSANISTLANKLITKIKIESSEDNIKETTVEFEFVPSIDSYISSDNTIPPWILFESIGNDSISYVINASFINNDKYTFTVVEYNSSFIKSQTSDLVSDFSKGIKADKKDKAKVKQHIITLATKLRTLDTQALSTVKKEQELPKSYTLSRGNIITNSYSGGDDSVIKYNFRMLNKMTAKDMIVNSVSKRGAESTVTKSYDLVSVIEVMDFCIKSLDTKSGSLKEFIYLLLGQVTTDGINYAPGRRNIPEKGVTIQTWKQTTSVSINDDRDKDLIDRRKAVKDYLDAKKITFDMSSIDDSDALFLSYILKSEGSTLGVLLNKTQTSKNFFTDDVKSNIKLAANNAGSAFPSFLNANNRKSIISGMYDTILAFKKDAALSNINDLKRYMNLIYSYFNISHSEKYPSTTETKVTFFTSSIKDKKPIVESATNTQTTNLVILDYGGAVVSFNQSIRSGGISMKDITGGKVSVTTTVDAGITLDFQISKAKIDAYAKAKEKTLMSYTSYQDLLISEARKDPDGFLLNFIDEVVDANTVITTPQTELLGGKGTQFLSLELRNPIPLIDRGTPIFFTTITDQERKELAVGTDESVRSYILPPKVRGMYVVTKVIHTFNSKENIWTQTLECER